MWQYNARCDKVDIGCVHVLFSVYNLVTRGTYEIWAHLCLRQKNRNSLINRNIHGSLFSHACSTFLLPAQVSLGLSSALFWTIFARFCSCLLIVSAVVSNALLYLLAILWLFLDAITDTLRLRTNNDHNHTQTFFTFTFAKH